MKKLNVLFVTFFMSITLFAQNNPFWGKSVHIRSDYMSIRDVATNKRNSGNANASIYIHFCHKVIILVNEADGQITDEIPYANYSVRYDYIEGRKVRVFEFFPAKNGILGVTLALDDTPEYSSAYLFYKSFDVFYSISNISVSDCY